MTLYADPSALLKLYVDEHDSGAAIAQMASDPVLVTPRIMARTGATSRCFGGTEPR